MKHLLLSLLVTLSIFQSVVAENKGVIENVFIHQDGEPDNYRGRALQIELNKVMEENSDVRFEVIIKAKTGFIYTWGSFLTSRSSYDQPSSIWLKNLSLGVNGRHTEKQKKDHFDREIVKGNIESLYIKIIEKHSGFFSRGDEIIGEHIFTNL